MTILALSTACGASAPSTAIPPLPTILAGDPGRPPLTLESTSEDIRLAMLDSANRWQTIWMDGIVIWNDPAGGGQPAQTFREQVWIEPKAARYRVLLSDVNGQAAVTLKICDGQATVEMNLVSGESQASALPTFVKEGSPESRPNMLWGQIGTPISEIALASNYASEQGTFQPIALDSVAGRETLIVEWTYTNGQLPQWRLWLDAQTAAILRLQEFGKGGETVQSERLVNAVKYNEVFDRSLFTAPSVPPQFAGAATEQPAPVGTQTIPQAGEVGLGDLYFFTLPQQAGQSIQLVRLPGECATGASACPALEAVAVPFPFNFTIEPLAWSRDGKLAAFAYSDDPAGTPTKLFLFDPDHGNWRSVAEFPYIDPPFWSPDGTWLAFRVQDGLGGENIFAIHRDGTDLKNLTASDSLPPEGRPYVMDGWLTENVIVRSALSGTTGGVYLLRASDGAVRPLFDTLLTKAALVVSPDNAWLAYDDYDYAGQKHVLKVVEPEGANPAELASFAGGNLYPIVWSPASTRIAFAHSRSDSNFNPVSDVYMLARDGKGMTQVYHGVTVGRILFSPDGRFLLIEETTSPTGGHLFVVNLETLEQRILAAPGLTLDTNWYAPSWRP
jgi:hypothetical protein